MAGRVDVRARVRGRDRLDPSEVLLPRDVRLPVRSRARGARPQLHHRRHLRAHETDAWLQRPAPVRLGRVRPARGECRDQDGHASRGVHVRQHQPHEGAVAASGHQLCLGPRDRDVSPQYYKFNQWIFLKMFERGLAYRRRSTVNWCPVDNTVLANEQVVNGACWRCGSIVEQRSLEQWFFKITAYADELLAGLETLSEWPEKVVVMQRNWIGRSKGARLTFPVSGAPGVTIEVFTTRIDTIYGATFVLLAPEHALVDRFAAESPDPQGVQRTNREVSCARQGSEARRRHREGRVRHRPEGPESLHGRGCAHLGREFRPRRVRHGRDHGRAGT